MEIINDFILFHIAEPGKNFYYKCELNDKLYCTENKYSCTKFVNRLSAVDKASELKRLFDLDFQVEELK